MTHDKQLEETHIMVVLRLGKDPDPDLDIQGKDLRVRIRIKMFRIRNTALGRGVVMVALCQEAKFVSWVSVRNKTQYRICLK